MFRFVKHIGGSQNVPEIEIIPVLVEDAVTLAETEYVDGQAVSYGTGGCCVTSSGAVKVDYIVVGEHTFTGGDADAIVTIPAYRVLPGMIFECPVEDLDATIHMVGKTCNIFTDGLQITDAVAAAIYGDLTEGSATVADAIPLPKLGARLIDKQGAAADGDLVLVEL